MGGNKVLSLLLLFALSGLLQATIVTSGGGAGGMPTVPIVALKGGSDGYFYIPNIPNLLYIKVELWYGGPNASQLWCDQTGGVSPYIGITNWPDGKVDSKDTAFISQHFGARETQQEGMNWDYMADCVPDRVVNMKDVATVNRNVGHTGTYSENMTDIRVKFNNNASFYTPGTDGYMQIPTGAVNFTVYNGSSPVVALITFYNGSGNVTKPQKCLGIGCPAEPVAQQPVSDTWDFAVIVLTIIGLCIGYFIMKEALSASVTRPVKKRKER